MTSPLLPYEHLLGRVPDKVIAEAAGSNVNNVRAYRFRRGIRLVDSVNRNKKGSGRPVVLTSLRSRILLWLQMHGATRSEALAEALLPDSGNRQHVYTQVNRLWREGKVTRLSRGVYAPLPE